MLFVPNHSNSLVDPLVLMASLRRPLTVTAKNALGRNPLLRWLMSALGVVTFHRREDAGKDTTDQRHNVRSMQRCREILAAGGAVCIFPEGVSHSDSGLRPFKSGPARIALDFVRKEGNPGRLRVVPVGLMYTQKDRMRSDVWLRFGDAIDVGRWQELHTPGDADALTEEIRRRVQTLTLNFESRRESTILSWAAEIVATSGQRPIPLGRPAPAPSELFRLTARLQAGYQVLQHDSPQELDQLSTRIRRYRHELRRLGIDAGEVYLPMHLGRALLFVARELELIVVGAPLALFGALNHLAPYWIVRRVAQRLSKDKDHWASNVIYPGLVVFPLFYLIQLLAAWLLLPVAWALLYSVALPYTGYYALLYGDRFTTTFRRSRTFLYFLMNRQSQTRLATEGSEILAHIRELGKRVELRAPYPQDDLDAPRGTPQFSMTASDFNRQVREDCDTLRQLLDGLERLRESWNEVRQTVQSRERGYFTPDEDDRVRQCLLSYRNHRLALYEMIGRYMDYEQVADRSEQLRGFMVGYAAALALCAASLQLIETYEHVPLVRAKLNEPDARFGLNAGFFEEIVRAYTAPHGFRLLHSAGRFWLRNRRDLRRLGLANDADCRWLGGIIRQQRSAVHSGFWGLFVRRLRYDWRALWRLLVSPVHWARYGLQSFVGATFSGLRTTLHYRPAIDEEALARLRNELQSGDVLLVRAEQKVTTALLPGFWAHAAIYIDSRGDLERMGIGQHPHVRKHLSAIPADGGQFGYVLEAISPGVLVNPLERCLYADHVVVLRPNVTATDMQEALVAAFGHVGKPYDFEFDFNVTSRLVCTELVYRSFHKRGAIDFPLVKRLGRFTLSGDDIMNWLLEQHSGNGAGDPPPFHVAALVLQSGSGGVRFVPPAEALAALRTIQSGEFPETTPIAVRP